MQTITIKSNHTRPYMCPFTHAKLTWLSHASNVCSKSHAPIHVLSTLIPTVTIEES